MMKGQKKHDEHTKEMWLHPQKVLGLEDILLSTREANMFKPNTRSDLYHQPDNILFDYKNWKIYNVEYKCNGNRAKAVQQLRETERVLRNMFRNYDVVNLYVSEDYKIEEIK